MFEYRDGAKKLFSHVDVAAWFGNAADSGLTIRQMITIAERADDLQRMSHRSDAAIEECGASDCWVTHLDQAECIEMGLGSEDR